MSKKIFIDLDRTIIDTDRLYNDMNKIISNAGIKNSDFEEKKADLLSKKDCFNYFSIIKAMNFPKYNVLINKLYQYILDNINDYVYDDVINFLNNVLLDGYIITVLTYGDMKFQMTKLLNLNIYDKINQIVITNKYKYSLDLDFCNSIFIDDNPRDLLGFYRRNAKKVIRIVRKGAKYSDKNLSEKNIVECHDLNFAYNIIKEVQYEE